MARSRLNLLGLLCCMVVTLCGAAQAELLVKPNDRIVFYGDSITEQRLYTRYIQQYLLCRYPDMKLTFINAGWGGDTTPGAANRMDRDVLAHNPTLVTLFFGMNDGRYTTVNEGATKSFRDGLEKIVTKLKDKNVRVVIFSPGCVDTDRKKDLGNVDYNKTLEGLAKVAEEVAKKYDVAFGDVIHPMLDFQAKQKAKDKNFTMIPDAVHPNPAGHLMMAQTMLKILGAEPMPAYGVLSAAEGTASGMKLVSKAEDKWVLETEAALAPFWIEPGSLSVARDCGMLDFAAPRLVAKGLPDGSYNVLNAKGLPIGRYAAADLANGIAIAGEAPDAGKPLHDMIAFKEDQYFRAWRHVQLALANVEGSSKAYKDLLEANESLGLLLQGMAKPAGKTTLTIIGAAAGGNLALKCKYEVSDPNKYNWGIGGLTDGSWNGTNTTCFATGDTASFPKHATVDLGSAVKINQIVFGVPAFGSTKNVKVSVSKDGTTFTDVGSYMFSQKKEERTTLKFDPTEARYVRLTYVDKYDAQAGYNANFAFTTELEVYGPAK